MRNELAALKSQRDKIVKESHKKAGMMFTLGLFGTMGQLFGFTYCIYGISDWNEMEPWTWIF